MNPTMFYTVIQLMTMHPHLLCVKVPAWCVAQLLHEAIIHDDHIFRSVSRYRLPGALPPSRSPHKDAVCANVTDRPIQDALAPCTSSHSLLVNFYRYKPNSLMYFSTLSGV